MAENAAMPPATAQARVAIRGAGTPLTVAASGWSAAARMPMPYLVRRRKYASAPSSTGVSSSIAVSEEPTAVVPMLKAGRPGGFG